MNTKNATSIKSCLPEAAEVVVLPAKEYIAILEHVQQLHRIIDIYIEPDMDILKEPEGSDWIEALRRKVHAQRDYGVRISDLEERISDLEKARPARQVKASAGKKTEERMLKVAITLVNRRNNPITFSEISKMLELGSRSADGKVSTRRQNMTLFSKKLQAAPERFIVKDSGMNNARTVHLTKIYYDHLVKEYL